LLTVPVLSLEGPLVASAAFAWAAGSAGLAATSMDSGGGNGALCLATCAIEVCGRNKRRSTVWNDFIK
jgi:hypothetical protein